MFPSELFYTKEHEWIRIEGDIATIGITHFAQRELGDIVYIDVTTLGQDLLRGDIFGTVEAVKTVSDLFMPMDGKIIEFNKNLDTAPESVNNDPYGAGWMIKVALIADSDTSHLLSPSQYEALL